MYSRLKFCEGDPMTQHIQTCPRYEEDHYGWSLATAELLRHKKYHEVDMDHVIEDLEDMARSDVRELISRLAILMAHLLKWQFQPDFRSRSWSGSIGEQRRRLRRLLKESPGLKTRIDESCEEAFGDSLMILQKETPIDLKILPVQCPYTFDQCMDEAFFPDAGGEGQKISG
jgi:hypothetical protein